MNLLLIIILSAILGSFINMLSYRLVNNLDIFWLKSHCVKCKNTLKWYNLIPIFSILYQQFKCNFCQKTIEKRYLFIEIISIIIGCFCYFFYDEYFYFWWLLYLLLFTMIVTDLEYLIVPDSLQLIFLAFTIYYLKNSDKIYDIWWQVIQSLILIGMLAGIVYVYYKVKNIIGLGMADIKFLAIAALWLDPLQISSMLFFSGLFGIVLGIIWKKLNQQVEFPFMPCLILSFIITLTY
jgi:prepilin signal peptidase PulO-like enzyme (type II secretory pathway)